MSDNEQAVQNQDFKDRKTGLVIFGILQIILGIVCALMIPLMIFSMVMRGSSSANMYATTTTTTIPGITFYVLFAVGFIWLGIGSIKARRWARALVLVISWIWIICGISGMLFMIFIMPDMYSRMPEKAAHFMKYFMIIFLSILYIIIPGANILFYGRKDVKLTCESRDPAIRWTDKCPLPVLAMSIIFAGWTPSMLLMGFYGWAIPFFGFILSGIPGLIIILIVMLLAGYVAWGSYKLDIKAWWGAVLLTIIWSVSAIITFLQKGIYELYEKMNFPEQQLAVMKQYDIMQGSTMSWYIGLNAIVFLVFLIYIKKYFKSSSANPYITG
ncbi:MAG: hypothetical protein JW983_04570 [Elusimicrobia bacterium]|nr:hypothetical protein [Elusimicrobiota bacterium]